MRLIPLRNNKGEIVAKAKVDDEDYQTISRYRWYLTDQGYAKRRHTIAHRKSILVLMHRVIMNAQKGTLIDHRNNNRLDNRKTNLRFCTKSENSLNRPKRQDNTSGTKNVYLNKLAKRWYIKTNMNGKEYQSHYFRTKCEAIRASKQFIHKIHGDYAYNR